MTIPQGRLRRTAPLAGISARAAGDGVVDVLRRRLRGERGASLEFHVGAETLGRDPADLDAAAANVGDSGCNGKLVHTTFTSASDPASRRNGEL